MNRRELAFCAAYAETLNVTESARLAGFASPRSNGYLIRKRPHVQEMIERLLNRMEEAIALDAAQVVNQFGAIALTRPDEFLAQRDDGFFYWKNPAELTERQLSAVSKIHVTDHLSQPDEEGHRQVDGQAYRYEFHDKAFALLQLGKHFDVFNETKTDDSGKLNRFRNLPADQLQAIGKALTGAMKEAEESDVG